MSLLSFFCNHNLVKFCKGKLSKLTMLAQVARFGMSDVQHGLFSRAVVYLGGQRELQYLGVSKSQVKISKSVPAS